MVRTNLDFLNVDADIQSLVVTSCVQGEGKSVAVANLAVSMALAGKKVIVVDGDLRRPRQHKYFGLRNEVGLSTVVTGQTNLAQSLQAVEVAGAAPGEPAADFAGWARGADALPHLYVLTSGPLPPNPGEIVAARRFAATIERLQREADLVIVDSPAMLARGRRLGHRHAASTASSSSSTCTSSSARSWRRPPTSCAACPAACSAPWCAATAHDGGRYGYYGAEYGYSYSENGGGKAAKKKAAARRSPAAQE